MTEHLQQLQSQLNKMTPQDRFNKAMSRISQDWKCPVCNGQGYEEVLVESSYCFDKYKRVPCKTCEDHMIYFEGLLAKDDPKQ